MECLNYFYNITKVEKDKYKVGKKFKRPEEASRNRNVLDQLASCLGREFIASSSQAVHIKQNPSSKQLGKSLKQKRLLSLFLNTAKANQRHSGSDLLLTGQKYKNIFMLMAPWLLCSSFVISSYSSLGAFYSVFHSTLVGICTYCAFIGFKIDEKYLSKFSLPCGLVSFCLSAPLSSLPYLSHELAKRGGEWGGDFYFLASLILSGQIYWLLLPLVLLIVIFGPRSFLINAAYIILFLGVFNFACFIVLISFGPLILDFVQDARYLFWAMLSFKI